MTESSNGVRGRVEWRRVMFIAVVAALAIVLAWKAWERGYERRIAAAAAAITTPSLQPPVTDVSDWFSRRVVLHQRDMMADLLDFDPRVDSANLLIDSCGRWVEAGDTRDDAIRLSYFDTWYKHAFTVELRPREGGAIATWHRVEMNPPPPQPGTATSRSAEAGEFSGMFRLTSPVTRKLNPEAWQNAVAVVRNPEFSQLAPGNMLGTDGFSINIESCIGGRYHLVNRWSPGGKQHRAFLDAAAAINKITGAVHALPAHEYYGEDLEGSP